MIVFCACERAEFMVSCLEEDIWTCHFTLSDIVMFFFFSFFLTFLDNQSILVDYFQ